MARFFISIVLAAAVLAPAQAQQTGPREPTFRDLPFDPSPRAPRTNPNPALRGDQAPEKPAPGAGRAAQTPAPAPTTLESLYERLAQARDAQESSALVKQIERRWMRSGSDTTDLLMTRASQAMSVKDNEAALELFDYIVLLRPQWAEAYHKRAMLLFAMTDYDGALRDLQAALVREPRHFSALSGVGLIMQQMDNKKAAYAAFTKALAINPHQENLKSITEKMKLEVEGQPL